jgi:ATP-binding cassette subfamily G (WHITE) protein 2
MFICKGQCVYHGSTKDVVPYFSKHAYQYELHDNPADYALDVLIDVGRKPNMLTALNNIYNTTHSESLTLLHQLGISTNNESLELQRRKYKIEAARSFKAEIFYLSQRTLRNAVRNPALALAQVVVSILIGLLVGLLFYDLKKTTDPGVQNRLGAIFFIVISQIFSNVTALEPFLQERALFIHVSFSSMAEIHFI